MYAVLQRLGNENSKALRLLIEDIWTRKLNTLSLTAVTSSGIIDVYDLPSIARQYYHRILTRMQSLEVYDVIHNRRCTASKMDVT